MLGGPQGVSPRAPLQMAHELAVPGSLRTGAVKRAAAGKAAPALASEELGLGPPRLFLLR